MVDGTGGNNNRGGGGGGSGNSVFHQQAMSPRLVSSCRLLSTSPLGLHISSVELSASSSAASSPINCCIHETVSPYRNSIFVELKMGSDYVSLSPTHSPSALFLTPYPSPAAIGLAMATYAWVFIGPRIVWESD